MTWAKNLGTALAQACIAEQGGPASERRFTKLLHAAEDNLALATMLAGRGVRNDRWFLETMGRGDELVEHRDNCGHCGYQVVGAEVARDMLRTIETFVKMIIEAGWEPPAMPYHGAIERWCAETERRWMESKYVKLWREELEAGRDPRVAFAKRGWEP